ncbi:MAG: hypothetical protein ACXADC_09670 [Candidatus Thorarchaeota archaeon]|jgi:hypothetical protein
MRMGMIEIMVLLSIMVTTIFLAIVAAVLGSDTRHSGRKDYYGPAKVAEVVHHPTLLGTAQGAGLGGYYGGRLRKRRKG